MSAALPLQLAAAATVTVSPLARAAALCAGYMDVLFPTVYQFYDSANNTAYALKRSCAGTATHSSGLAPAPPRTQAVLRRHRHAVTPPCAVRCHAVIRDPCAVVCNAVPPYRRAAVLVFFPQTVC